MADYIYTRALVNGSYDINNVARVDGEGNQIYLYKEIQAEVTLPDEFDIHCVTTVCTITFETSLTEGQQTTLDSIVAVHKANT